MDGERRDAGMWGWKGTENLFENNDDDDDDDGDDNDNNIDINNNNSYKNILPHSQENS